MAQVGCLRQLYFSLQSVCQNAASNPSLHFLLQKSHTKEPRLLLYLLRGFGNASVKSEDNASRQMPAISKSDEPGCDSRSTRTEPRKTKLKKLHNRVLSEVAKGEMAGFRKSLLSFPDEDSFGGLKKKEQKSKHVNIAEKVSNSNYSGSQVTALEEEQNIGFQMQNREHHLRVRRRNTYRPDLRAHDSRRNKTDGWSDTFGTLQKDSLEERIKESLTSDVATHDERLSDDEEEEKDDRSHIRLSATDRRHIPMWYGRKITKLNKRGRVREAIQLLEESMLKKDRVKPDSYVFTSLICGLGHAGYTAKAFSLFNKMKKMGIIPKPQIYTALFNACANSPWPEDGLRRADHLLQLMLEKKIEPTLITGKAMIKAFGMCGDLRRAFALVDQLSQSFRLDQEVFSSILMACVSDKQAGFRHSIQVWRLMLQMRVRPDLPLYNLLLRCVRDCGVGEVATVEDLLGKTTYSAKEKAQTCISSMKDNKEVLLPPPVMTGITDGFPPTKVNQEEDFLESSGQHSKLEFLGGVSSKERTYKMGYNDPDSNKDISQRISPGGQKQLLSIISHPVDIPDLLSPTSCKATVAALGDLSCKENRLALLGGVDGILKRMEKDGVKPDIRTFSQLVTVAMPTLEAEKKLIAEIKKMKVQPDVDFFNMLMHKRIARRDFADAKDIQDEIKKNKLTANLRTYGILAMTCWSEKDGQQLLKDMEDAEVQPNIEILGTLMRASGLKFGYKLKVLQVVQKLDMAPNTIFLRHIESSLAQARQKIVEAETKEEKDNFLLSEKFQKSMERFEHQYKEWLKATQVEKNPHPWAAFKPKPLTVDTEAAISRV